MLDKVNNALGLRRMLVFMLLTGLSLCGAAAWASPTKRLPSKSSRSIAATSSQSERVASGIYLRGSINGWSAVSSYEFFYLGADRGYIYLTGVSLTTEDEFKVADESWGDINFGGTAYPGIVDVNSPYYMEITDYNLQMSVDVSNADVRVNTNTWTLEIGYNLLPGESGGDPELPAVSVPSVIPESCAFNKSISVAITSPDDNAIYYQIAYPGSGTSPVDLHSVYFSNERNWNGNINCYIRDLTSFQEYGGSWPGSVCTQLPDGVWKWTDATGSIGNEQAGVIFNNSSSQTGDMTWMCGGLYTPDGYQGTYMGGSAEIDWSACEWVRYSGPITLTRSALIRAKAVDADGNESSVVEMSYELEHPAPVFIPAPCDFVDTMTVEISAEAGETIYYTTDGTMPGASNGTLYSGPIVISNTTTFYAVSVNSEGDYSKVATATYRNARHGIGEDYNPTSPGNPEGEQPAVKGYRLWIVANPTCGGYTYENSKEVAAGSQVYVSCSANTGFNFVNWTIDGDVVSEESYIYYLMPDHDVTIVANFDYNPSSPGNPNPEEQKVSHPVVARAIPSCAAYMSPGQPFTMEENESRNVYAYPESGWRLVGWTVNGEKMESTDTSLQITMGEKALDIAAYFAYEPSSPANPGANYFNPATGQTIIDDFTPGNLYNALYGLVSDLSKVGSLIVKGEMNSGDMGCVYYLKNASSLDFSRTGGVQTVESWTFSGSPAANIALPSTITSIGGYAFNECGNLASLTVYSPVPPTCYSSTFSGFPGMSSLTVFVPASSIELYQEAEAWKGFNIMPIVSDVHTLRITLPEEASDGRYKNNSLEIVNVNTGVRQKYVVSDRLVYTFSGLQADEQFNIYMFSQSGLEIGHVENVLIPDADIDVTFDYLRPLYAVSARVMTPQGDDVTSDATVEWLRQRSDGTSTYLRKGVSLGDIPEGETLLCRVALNSKLGVVYETPSDTPLTVSEETATCRVALSPLRSIELSGCVTNSDGEPLNGAVVAMNQTLAGKYSKSYTAKTDRMGLWTLPVLDAPETRIVYSATECVNLNDTVKAFDKDMDKLDLGSVALRSIVGARISCGFTYLEAGKTEPQDYYEDYQNVSVSVFNLTQNREHKDVSMQYPLLVVLDENINDGDRLRLTAVSKNGAFHPVTTTVAVDEAGRGEVTFDIIGKGGIEATFEMTDNTGVIAMLYNAKGELVKKSTYSEAKASFAELSDGEYTLVTMGSSDLMSSVLRLSSFDEIGLEAGKDYLADKVKVEAGKITAVSNSTVPTFDETLFYYTTPTTSFLSNKANVTTGNYLTLRSGIDFKSMYKNGVKNVALIVDLPQECDLIEQSVIQGPNLLPYTYDNHRLVVQLGSNYTGQVRFCVIPTVGGSFFATGSVAFDYDGKTITQPIGTATAEIKDMEIVVPGITNNPLFTVSGKAAARSSVQVYDGTALIGTGSVNGYGDYSIKCELENPANLSSHDISAVITTPEGNELHTAASTIVYDMDCIKVLSVTMTEGSNKVVFDFENPDSQEKYYYYSFGKFTFTIEFNSPEAVKSAMLYVHTTDGSIIPLKAIYDSKKNIWFATEQFSTQALPLNVSVDFDYEQKPLVDANMINDSFVTEFENTEENASNVKKEIASIEEASKEEIASCEETETEISELIARISEESVTSSEDLSRLFELLDVESRTSGTDIDEDKVYTEAEIDALLAWGETLLDNEEYDSTESDALITAIEALLSELDNEWQIDQSLDVDANESITFEYEGETYTCRRATQDELGTIDLDSFECEVANLTDGGQLKLYHCDTQLVVVNESTGVMFLVTGQSAQGVGRFCAFGLKEVSVTYLEKLRDQFKTLYTNLSSIINNMAEGFRNDVKRLKGLVKDTEMNLSLKYGASSGKAIRVSDIEKQLRELELAGKGSYKQVDLIAQKMALESQRKQLLKDIEKITKEIAPIKTRLASLKVKLVAANAFVAEIADWWQMVSGVFNMIRFASEGIADCNRWNGFIDTILPCPDDEAAASRLVSLSQTNRNSALKGYIGAFTLAGVSTAISAAMKFSGKPAGWFIKLICGCLNGALFETSKSVFQSTKATSHNNLNNRIADRNSLRCKKPKDEYTDPYPVPDNPSDPDNDKKPNPGGGHHHSGNTDTKYGIDPSGYVYEAVPANRVQGVQATIYYKETKEDMYGDPYEDIVLWNAEEYAQKNPLFTDENGMYRWDVPQGLWQVKFEKDGYLTAYSEWLPVPPPQLDVNIPIVQNKQPEVVDARAYETGIEVGFDKYMDPSTLTAENVFVTANGEMLPGSVALLNAALADELSSEEDADASRFASRLRFIPDEPLSINTGEVRLTVSRNVRSYAGIPMADNYSQVLGVEKEVQAIVADDIQVLYGGERSLTVFATPFDAAVGRTLRVASSSDMVISIDKDEVVLDEEGKASIVVTGELPGSAQLAFSIDDVTVTGSCTVEVVTELTDADAPTASRLSGTALYRGTEVELSTATKNGVIYYTLDGSCPCEEGSRQLYTKPIVVNEDIVIKAYTVVELEDGFDYSDVAEFRYTLKHNDMDFIMVDGWNWVSHGFDSPVSVSTFAADKNIVRIVGHSSEAVRSAEGDMTGALDALNANENYKVQAQSATSRLRLSEVARDPSLPIKVAEGCNWLGYPVGQAMSVDEAFAPTLLEEGDYVVGQNGFAQYDGSKWVGTLSTMAPGLGYMFHSESDKYVNYNTAVVAANASRRGVTTYVDSAPWSADAYKYPDIMCMVMTLEDAGGGVIDVNDYYIGAFVGSECRGVSKVVDDKLLMSIHGNADEQVKFHAMAVDSDDELVLVDSKTMAETLIGSVKSPYVLVLKNEEVGIETIGAKSPWNLVVEDGTLRLVGGDHADISGFSIFDMEGCKVVSRAALGAEGINVSALSPGVYVAMIVEGESYTYLKFALK